MILDNLPSLAALEIDLASSEMVRRRSRPIGEMNAKLCKRWSDTIKERSAGKLPSYETLKGDMLGAANADRDKDTGLKQLPMSPWPLAVPSFQHWSSKGVKNLKRDASKYALVSLAEVVVVSGYRRTLLKKSDAARFFRTKIWKMLNQDLKKRAGVATQWNFPDGIEWQHTYGAHEYENVGELLQEHAYAHEGKGRAQDITGLINKIVKHPFALMKPGDPAYTGVVAPEVDASVRQLFDVSHDVFI
jgi:hypothetical protein